LAPIAADTGHLRAATRHEDTTKLALFDAFDQRIVYGKASDRLLLNATPTKPSPLV
jgi:hypothetical protein